METAEKRASPLSNIWDGGERTPWAAFPLIAIPYTAIKGDQMILISILILMLMPTLER